MESHSGAETMPEEISSVEKYVRFFSGEVTILDQDIQALFHGQGGIEYDQAEAEWQHIVACAGFQKVANRVLPLSQPDIHWSCWPGAAISGASRGGFGGSIASPEQTSRLCRSDSLIARSWSDSDLVVVADNSGVGPAGLVTRKRGYCCGQGRPWRRPTNRPWFGGCWTGTRLAKLRRCQRKILSRE